MDQQKQPGLNDLNEVKFEADVSIYRKMGFSADCSEKIAKHLATHVAVSALSFLEKILTDREVLSFFEGLAARNIPFDIALGYAEKVANYAPEWRKVAMDVFNLRATEMEPQNRPLNPSLDASIQEAQRLVRRFELKPFERGEYDDLELLKLVPSEKVPFVVVYAHQGYPFRLAVEIAMASDSIGALDEDQKGQLVELCKPFCFFDRSDHPVYDCEEKNYPSGLIEVIDIIYADRLTNESEWGYRMPYETFFNDHMYAVRSAGPYLEMVAFTEAFLESSSIPNLLKRFAKNAIFLVDSDVIRESSKDYYFENGSSKTAEIALNHAVNRSVVEAALPIANRLMEILDFSDRLKGVYEKLILAADQVVENELVGQYDDEEEDGLSEKLNNANSKETDENGFEDFSRGIQELLSYLNKRPGLFSDLFDHRNQFDEIPRSDTVTMQLVHIIRLFSDLMNLHADLRGVFEDYLTNCEALLKLARFFKRDDDFSTSVGERICSSFQSFQEDNEALKINLKEIDPQLLAIFEQHETRAKAPKDCIEATHQTREAMAIAIDPE